MNRMRYRYMNTAEMLDLVFHLYKKSFLYQLIKTFIISSLSAVLYFIAIFTAALFVLSVYSYSSGSPSGITVIICASVILITFVGVLISLDTSASLSVCKQIYCGRRPNFNFTLKESLKNTGRVFSVYIMYFLMCAPIFFIIALFVLFSGAFRSFPQIFDFNFNQYMSPANILTVISVAAAAVCAAVYILFAQTVLSCALGCAAYEKLSFSGAVKKSFLLTKGQRKAIAAALILWAAVNFMMNYSISALANIPLAAAAVFDYQFSDASFVLFSVLNYISLIVSVILTAPFSNVLTSVIYFNQKIKKEGFNIILELET